MGVMRQETRATESFLDPGVIAAELGVRRATILRWVREGVLPGVKLGRKVLVPRDALRLMLQRRLAIRGNPTTGVADAGTESGVSDRSPS